ncbi:hypothetical protein WN48_01004 [Eufriesea mexicana]|nr:hypothetical protein WN48_01004 [Eufriesea mexicana]
MACVSPALVAASHWFLFVAVTAFIACLLWCFIYVLSIREALKLPINWILTELLNTAIFAVLYMIAFIAQLSAWSVTHSSFTSRNIAGGALGIVCVAIVGNHISLYQSYAYTGELFFLLMTTTFLIGTFILLVSCLASFSSAAVIAKSIYELLYHSIAFGLYLAASLTYSVHVFKMKGYREYETLMAAVICGLINSALYLFSTILAVRTYRGI